MRTYIEISFRVSREISELLVAELAEAGYDGFLEEEESLKAYIDAKGFDRLYADQIAGRYGASYEVASVEEKNWNALWESSFEPVIIENFAAIRADFHSSVEDVEFEIVITPKMSFGTGHHATTNLMIGAMGEMRERIKGARVFDFGTGTGVLAILAEKLKAKEVVAVDNDIWSIDNARENISRNGTSRIELELAEAVPTGRQFDVILANINKHILIAHCGSICQALAPGGRVLLSGILEEDRADIVGAFGALLDGPVYTGQRNNWLLLAFSKRLTDQG